MDKETLAIISQLPISSYRKRLISKSECFDRNELLTIIYKELSETSELFCICPTIVLSLLYENGFKTLKLQDDFFSDDNFLTKNGYIQRQEDWFAPQSTVFPKDYFVLKYINISEYQINEESICNITGRGFNRCLAILSLIQCQGNEEKALKKLQNHIDDVKNNLKNKHNLLRELIYPSKNVIHQCPLLGLSPQFYFDICMIYNEDSSIITSVNNGTIPSSMKLWYNELDKKLTQQHKKRDEKLEAQSITCDVCYEDKLEEEMFTNRCGHSFCKQCVIEQILTGMRENGKNIGNLKCLSSGCHCCITMDIVRYLVDDYTYYRYCELLITGFIEGNKDFLCRYCFNERCNKVLHYKGSLLDNNKTAICSCQTNMCLLCGEANHRPATCEQWRLWQELLKKGGLNLKWIRTNSRPCPACSTFIEKNGGCQWMCCYKCHCFFCWMCMQVTNDHHHKPGQKCIPYQQKEINSDDHIDEDLLSCLTHYDLQDVGVKQSLERYSTILEIMKKQKSIATTLSPLYEASLVEIDAHTVLRNLYVLEYFNKDKKDLYDFQMTQFQYPAEVLTKKIQYILKAEKITINMMSDLDKCVTSIKKTFEKITSSYEDDQQ
ncbi:hypothetical protein ENUP19_0018G0077 [Entamoeba nuttalli]|uniref:RBR-type E3 ubiquitin transferase n=1 Tax=Entamoeba nuttalli TaxID=412467 RepID=A0ABQ0D8S1_9EUKA